MAEKEPNVALVKPEEKPAVVPPFRCLGYSLGVYYYFSRGEQAVVAISAGAHGKKSLYRLAPHSYWVKEYPGKKDDFAEDQASSRLMETCQAAGIFSVKKMRGRGVWYDKGGVIIHYGDRVTIEGVDYKPFLTPGKYIYELAEPLGFMPCNPLKPEQGQQFTSLIEQLRWQTPDQHQWFSGWLVCALIGGALSWRPHIWLTGGAQSGKSTLSKIMNSILRGNCLYIKSVSTEAGIRQTLKADCLAVVMDEAEREDATSHGRIQSILCLARQASSDDDSRIVKGTPLGTALNFQIRSPFCLSSINPSLTQSADKGRFTNIELSSKKLTGDVYAKWEKEMDDLLTDDYVQGLYSRVFNLVPTIVQNAKTIARAIEAKTGDRRLGDQYGALLAGHLILSNDSLLDHEGAKWLIDDINFVLEKELASGINDQTRLLNKIMQHVDRIPKDKAFEHITIAEMCERIHINIDFSGECKNFLGNHGIAVKGGFIYIANDNDNLGNILRNTNWPSNWSQTLKRLEFARTSENAVYFSPSCRARAIMLPVDQVIFDEEDQQ